MVKWEYDVADECFKRTDKRGKPYWINISEARQIETLLDLGYSIPKIYSKVNFNRDVTIGSLRNFINNLREGKISTEGEYPAPESVVDEMTLEMRVVKLEEDNERFRRFIETSTVESEAKRLENNSSWKNLWGRL